MKSEAGNLLLKFYCCCRVDAVGWGDCHRWHIHLISGCLSEFGTAHIQALIEKPSISIFDVMNINNVPNPVCTYRAPKGYQHTQFIKWGWQTNLGSHKYNQCTSIELDSGSPVCHLEPSSCRAYLLFILNHLSKSLNLWCDTMGQTTCTEG